jgi:hypothetical protein
LVNALTTWADVERLVYHTYKVALAKAGWLSLTFGFSSPEGEVLQAVELSEVEGEGQVWVRVLAIVGPCGLIPAEAALRQNHDLVCGRLAVVDEKLVLAQHILLPSARPEELDLALRTVAREAARLRETARRGASRAPVFTIFAE